MNRCNMLSDRSQTQEATHCTIPFKWNAQEGQTHSNRKQMTGGLGVGKGKESFWNGRKCFKLDCANGYTTL